MALPTTGDRPAIGTVDAIAHLAVSLVVGTISFSVMVPLVATGLPLLIVALAGAPLLVIAFTLAHLLARFERFRAREMLQVELPVRSLPHGRSYFRRVWSWLRSRGAWLEVLYATLALPFVGWIGGGLVFAALGSGLAFLLYPAYGWALAAPGETLGWDPGFAVASLVHVAAGVALLAVAPWLARQAVGISLDLARAQLSPGEHEALTERVHTLEETRADMVAAADAERRRIERDLHDGAQQRLVALAMTLGRAQTRFEEDPEGARGLVAEAHGEAKEALAELRDLARGIHPAVLSDRGLDAALSALAARCPVPVDVSVDIDSRCSPATEAVAYFFVAEALTNVAKHSGATRASVSALRALDRLTVEVSDDGRGGAALAGNSGLGGLRDRARAVDGSFEFTSPAGGPTVLRLELPCGS